MRVSSLITIKPYVTLFFTVSAEDILQAQLGVEGCLACRTRKCQWTGTVDVPVVTKRIHALDKELERVKLNKEAAVMESEVL